MRAPLLLLALLLAIAATVIPNRGYVPPDPNDPIAADGSLTAGRAHTVFDALPALGSFLEPERAVDLDDPAIYEARIAIERPVMERRRKEIVANLGPFDPSLCTQTKHKRLLLAVREYYYLRSSLKKNFARRGPKSKAAMEREWSSPLDQRIDELVRRAVQSGLLHKREMSRHEFPEFVKVVTDTTQVKAGCRW